MDQSTLGSSKKQDETEFNLSEWAHKAKISREKNNSRRYSASHIRSFREDHAKSFRSNVIISSTASSPGYTLREEFDPSKYSFTTALKALKAKTMYNWEYMSPDGLALNSKWNEAEKYICNPLSGEVPLECLSTKTLNERSFRQSTSKITNVSSPLFYPTQIQEKQQHVKPSLPVHDVEIQMQSKEKKEVISIARDMGIKQSIQECVSSNSPSPTHTPSIEERSIKQSEEAVYSPMTTPSTKERSIEQLEANNDDFLMTTPKLNCQEKAEVKETIERKDMKRSEEGHERKKVKQMCRQGGCLSWKSLWIMRRRRRQREKHKSKDKTIFLCHINACYKE